MHRVQKVVKRPEFETYHLNLLAYLRGQIAYVFNSHVEQLGLPVVGGPALGINQALGFILGYRKIEPLTIKLYSVIVLLRYFSAL